MVSCVVVFTREFSHCLGRLDCRHLSEGRLNSVISDTLTLVSQEVCKRRLLIMQGWKTKLLSFLLCGTGRQVLMLPAGTILTLCKSVFGKVQSVLFLNVKHFA